MSGQNALRVKRAGFADRGYTITLNSNKYTAMAAPEHSPLTLKLQEITERYSALMRQAHEPYGQVIEAAREQIERKSERLTELSVNAQPVDPRAAINPWARNEAAELRNDIMRLKTVIDRADTEYTFIKHNIRLAQDAEMDALGVEMQNPDHPWYHEYRHRMFPNLYPMNGSGMKGGTTTPHNMRRGEYW